MHMMRVIIHNMEACREREASDDANEKDTENNDVNDQGIMIPRCIDLIETKAYDAKTDRPQEMAVDVDGLVVESERGLQRVSIRVGKGSIIPMNKVVVALPML